MSQKERQIERRRLAVDLHEQGLSTQKISEELGCSWETARSDLESAGYTFQRSARAARVEERVCAREGCDTRFTPKPAQLRKGYGLYCKRECDHEAHRIHPKPEPRDCGRCGTRFTPTGANVAMGWGTYCSKRCSAISTDAHRKKKGRIITCLNCGRERWRYEAQLTRGSYQGQFCRRECWGQYRWKHGIAISPDVVSLARGSSRQVWYGRWNGHKGATAGIEAGRAKGGRPATMTPEQQQQILQLDADGHSTRAIAAEVFGDARYKDRVARFLHR